MSATFVIESVHGLKQTVVIGPMTTTDDAVTVDRKAAVAKPERKRESDAGKAE